MQPVVAVTSSILDYPNTLILTLMQPVVAVASVHPLPKRGGGCGERATGCERVALFAILTHRSEARLMVSPQQIWLAYKKGVPERQQPNSVDAEVSGDKGHRGTRTTRQCLVDSLLAVMSRFPQGFAS
jgi:hypothetical protein